MPLRFFIKQWLLPPGLLILLLLLGWCLRGRFPRLSTLCFVMGLAGLWLMSLPLVVQQSARLLEREAPLAVRAWPQLAQQADAIVVLGAGRERGDPAWGASDQPSLLALERMRFAANLAKACGLPLLASGGLHFGEPPSEAQLMAERLQADFGIAVTWQEGRSRTTWENAVYSAEVLQPLGKRRIVLVTQAWHMPRARWSFERAGFTVIAAPMGALGSAEGRPFAGLLPESRAIGQNAQLLNEALGLLAYRLLY